MAFNFFKRSRTIVPHVNSETTPLLCVNDKKAPSKKTPEVKVDSLFRVLRNMHRENKLKVILSEMKKENTVNTKFTLHLSAIDGKKNNIAISKFIISDDTDFRLEFVFKMYRVQISESKFTYIATHPDALDLFIQVVRCMLSLDPHKTKLIYGKDKQTRDLGSLLRFLEKSKKSIDEYIEENVTVIIKKYEVIPTIKKEADPTPIQKTYDDKGCHSEADTTPIQKTYDDKDCHSEIDSTETTGLIQ